MRADRLLSLMLLLQARGRMTAQALAEELEVSRRTIPRGSTRQADFSSRAAWALIRHHKIDRINVAWTVSFARLMSVLYESVVNVSNKKTTTDNSLTFH